MAPYEQNFLPETAISRHPPPMPQSLAKVYLHLVFSTKNRERSTPDHIHASLNSYIGGILQGLGCTPIEINREPDHTHILFLMSRIQTISDVVGNTKKSSNDWLRQQSPEFSDFYWQGGYAIFSVSQSNVEDVRQYIRTQRGHHARVSFQDEFRAFLKRHELDFDEHYVWD
jgi:putative transposase